MKAMHPPIYPHFFYTCRLETLRRHLPVSVPEGLNELQRIAVRFEEKIYTAATSQVIWPIFATCQALGISYGGLWANNRAKLPPNVVQVFFTCSWEHILILLMLGNKFIFFSVVPGLELGSWVCERPHSNHLEHIPVILACSHLVYLQIVS
jgi:hypothetical protein